MRAYRCDMCRQVIMLNDGGLCDFEEPPMSINYRFKNFAQKGEEYYHHFDICHDCAQKIEAFISDKIPNYVGHMSQIIMDPFAEFDPMRKDTRNE